MIERTPVVKSLPNVLRRVFKPERTPIVRNRVIRGIKDVLDNVKSSDIEHSAVLAEASLIDSNWDELYDECLRKSCAYFASEILSGPKEAPYNGRFILGPQHLKWDRLINKHKRLNILASRDHGKCTIGESLVLSASGKRIPIKDWKGGGVVAYDSSNYSLVRTPAGATHYVGKQACVKVTTRTGRTETVTLNHRFMTADGEVYASDLCVGDRIAVAKELPIEGTKPLLPGEAWLIALLNGDGQLKTTTPRLTKYDQDVVEYARFATKQVGGELVDYVGKCRYGLKGIIPWLKDIKLGRVKSAFKTIPECVFTAPNSDVAEYVAGAVDTDCGINTHGGGSVTFSSTSEQLLRELQHLLMRLGVVSVLTSHTSQYKGEPYISWLLTVRGRSICVLADKVKPKGHRAALLTELAANQAKKAEGGSVDLLSKSVYSWLSHGKAWFKRRGYPSYDKKYDLTRTKAFKLAEGEGNSRLAALAASPILWDSVIKLEDVGEQDVYSFAVPNYETYVGQDIINHNSNFFTVAYSIWKAGFNEPGSYGILFSAKQDQAESFLAKIQQEIRTNSKLAHLIPVSGTRFWSARKMTLRNGSVIRAVGFGTRIRGEHPDWCVCDDVLSDNDIYSETVRRRNIDYFLSAIAGMVHRQKQLIVVGTPLSAKDLYAILHSSGYVCRSYPAINKDGSALWPARYNLEDLAAKRKELNSESRFAREFLCRPMSDEASLFPSKLFEGRKVRLPYVLGMSGEYWAKRGCTCYTGVDIAMSAETGGDYFVVFTAAVDKWGNRWVANIRRGKGWSFVKQIDAIKEEYYLMNSAMIYIEANQMQRVWSDELVRTTDLPVRKFFTTGVGGRQPTNSWKKGATRTSANKNHLDLGVPSLRITFEHKKWRIARGDQNSIELTDLWIGELNALGWIDGKVISVGDHDDLAMASWMCDRAIRDGGNALEFLDSGEDDTPTALLAAPKVTDEDKLQSNFKVAEELALAAIQARGRVKVAKDAYFARVRGAIRSYSEQLMDGGHHERGIHAIQELKRLDAQFGFRAYDADIQELASDGSAEYSAEWKPNENIPSPTDLDIG